MMIVLGWAGLCGLGALGGGPGGPLSAGLFSRPGGRGLVIRFGAVGSGALRGGAGGLCVQVCFQGWLARAFEFYDECAGLDWAGLGCVVWSCGLVV